MRWGLQLWVALFVLAVSGGACKCKKSAALSDAGLDAGVDAGDPCDLDGDGFRAVSCGGDDCNDGDVAVNPGQSEVCGDGKDNDCQNGPDDGCPCTNGLTRPCYTGPAGTEGVAACIGGSQLCTGEQWGACTGEVLPDFEACDSIDNDCDGDTDETLVNACGFCGAPPVERCGDSLDSDCDGQIDPATGCSTDCSFLPDNFIVDCVADPTLDPRCCCIVDPGSCASCIERTNQPCYTGPAQTLGNGICTGGLTDCTGGTWGTCAGQTEPAATDTCGNDVDDDCNGLIDDGCPFPCTPTAEVCDGLDNDCNGTVDEGCATTGTQPCYDGPIGTVDVGECDWGIQTAFGEFWGPCVGAVTPAPERCDNKDNDCDGTLDEGCCTVNQVGIDVLTGDEVLCNGIDDDCNGLVDEGLLNACGQCPGNPCYVETYPDVGNGGWDCGADCSLDGVAPGDPTDPNSQCGVNQICLNTSVFDQPYIWIARTAEQEVERINTDTFLSELRVPSGGWSPSRTAVAVDGSVWVGNRGCEFNLVGCDAGNPLYGNATHIATDGTVICRADVTSPNPAPSNIAVRAITLDGNDNAWIGNWDEGTIYQYSGSQVDATQTPPRCVQIRRVDLQGSRAYGAVVNSEGELWIATLGTGNTLRIDTGSGAILSSVVLNHPSYGIAIDMSDNVWFGVWDTVGGLMRVDNGTFAVSYHLPGTPPCAGDQRTRGVAVDFDGNMWVAVYYCNIVSKYADDGTWLANYPLGSGTGPLGVAVDNSGKIWVVNYLSSSASVLLTDGTLVTEVTGLSSPYTYSVMTGLQLRLVTRQGGTWINTFDSGWAGARWSRLEWTVSTMPPGTSVCLRGRSAATRAGLTTATWSAAQCSPPIAHVPPPAVASIAGLVPDGRYLQVEVELNGSNDLSPVVDGVEVFWERP